jgi:hypothetical protein
LAILPFLESSQAATVRGIFRRCGSAWMTTASKPWVQVLFQKLVINDRGKVVDRLVKQLDCH